MSVPRLLPLLALLAGCSRREGDAKDETGDTGTGGVDTAETADTTDTAETADSADTEDSADTGDTDETGDTEDTRESGDTDRPQPSFDRPHRIAGLDEGQAFGWSSAVGDFDGNGVIDAAISQLGYAATAGAAGAIFVFADPDRSITTGDAYAHAVGDTDDRAGWSLSSAGDVDGDGTTDLLVGGPYAKPDGDEQGAAWLLLGPLTGESSLADAAAMYWDDLETVGGNFGWSVAGGADLDADGTPDLLIGEPYLNVTFLMSGADRGTLDMTTARASFRADNAEELAFAGDALCSTVDLDGDGLPDVAIGASLDGTSPDGSVVGPGGVYVFHSPVAGARTFSDADAHVLGYPDGTEAGRFLAAGDDLDGDGAEDLLVGSFFAPDAGRISIVSGPLAAESSLATATARIDQADTATAPGDVDGDARGDLVLADTVQEGTVRLLPGPFAGIVPADDGFELMNGESTEAAAGSTLAHADFDGDSLVDLLVGAPFDSLDGDSLGAAYVLSGLE